MQSDTGDRQDDRHQDLETAIIKEVMKRFKKVMTDIDDQIVKDFMGAMIKRRAKRFARSLSPLLQEIELTWKETENQVMGGIRQLLAFDDMMTNITDTLPIRLKDIHQEYANMYQEDPKTDLKVTSNTEKDIKTSPTNPLSAPPLPANPSIPTNHPLPNPLPPNTRPPITPPVIQATGRQTTITAFRHMTSTHRPALAVESPDRGRPNHDVRYSQVLDMIRNRNLHNPGIMDGVRYRMNYADGKVERFKDDLQDRIIINGIEVFKSAEKRPHSCSKNQEIANGNLISETPSIPRSRSRSLEKHNFSNIPKFMAHKKTPKSSNLPNLTKPEASTQDTVTKYDKKQTIIFIATFKFRGEKFLPDIFTDTDTCMSLIGTGSGDGTFVISGKNQFCLFSHQKNHVQVYQYKDLAIEGCVVNYLETNDLKATSISILVLEHFETKNLTLCFVRDLKNNKGSIMQSTVELTSPTVLMVNRCLIFARSDGLCCFPIENFNSWEWKGENKFKIFNYLDIEDIVDVCHNDKYVFAVNENCSKIGKSIIKRDSHGRMSSKATYQVTADINDFHYNIAGKSLKSISIQCVQSLIVVACKSAILIYDMNFVPINKLTLFGLVRLVPIESCRYLMAALLSNSSISLVSVHSNNIKISEAISMEMAGDTILAMHMTSKNIECVKVDARNTSPSTHMQSSVLPNHVVRFTDVGTTRLFLESEDSKKSINNEASRFNKILAVNDTSIAISNNDNYTVLIDVVTN